MQKILNNGCVYIYKNPPVSWQLHRDLCVTAALLLSTSTAAVSLCGRRARTKCHYGNQSLSAVSDWKKNTDHPFSISTLDLPCYTSGFFFLSLQTISLNSFPSWRTVTHCRQKASRCILIRQRRGLQLIDITVILFWSTFFFISTALHCSLRVHRRLVAFSPTQR